MATGHPVDWDQLIFATLIYHHVTFVSDPSVLEGAGIVVLPNWNNDSGSDTTLPMTEAETVPAAVSGSLMAAHCDSQILFSQQFIIQYLVKDLR